ncbi:dethiobiotin synthase [bacterium]|nr:MAG: dethiobiotin synthase [bacterium]
MATYFVTGIDTAMGKTVATGMMARFLLKRHKKAATAKLVQAGCEGLPEDILTHRRLMGIEPIEEDYNGLSCPYVFRFPASPHLAARIEGAEIDPGKILSALSVMEKLYDPLLIEGAGGLLVPLRKNLLCADLAAFAGWKLIVVSSAKLGSINHTFLTLEAATNRNIPVAGIVYNHFEKQGPAILRDSREMMLYALERMGLPGALVDLPEVTDFDSPPEVDFSPLFPQ